MIKSVINNMSWSLLGKLVRLSLNLIVLGQIILFLGYELYGDVLLLLTIQSYCAIISSGGVEVNFGKTLVKYPERRLLETILLLKFFLSGVIALSVFFFFSFADPILIFACLLGGLSFLNLIEIKLSAEHKHREAISYTLGIHVLSFIVKISLMSMDLNKDILIYYLLAEGLVISLVYSGFVNLSDLFRLRIDLKYLTQSLYFSLRFVPQRLSFIFASTCALFFCRGMYDGVVFGEIAVSFKIVGFCYLMFATLTSSYEKIIYGKIKKIHGFVTMYQTMLVLYLAVIVGVGGLYFLQTLIKSSFLEIYINKLNFFGICASLPFFMSVALNKWYVLNESYWYLPIQNIMISLIIFLLSFFDLYYGAYQFWMIVGIAYSFGIGTIIFFDKYRRRHLLIFRSALWPKLRY